MVVVDGFASAPWYLDHLRPIMDALGEHAGTLFVKPGMQGDTRKPIGTAPIITLSYGDFADAWRSGRRRLVLGQHGAGQSYLDPEGAPLPNQSYAGGMNQEGVGLFLVPNATAAEMTRHRYPRANVAIVGCPKLDGLPQKRTKGRTVAFSIHWPGHVAPEAGNAWSTFGRALLDLAKHYKVLGHAHPREIGRVGRLYKAAGIEVVPDFSDVLRRADVYVCDNSSSMFEFAATGRPVVVMNAYAYRPGHRHGLRFWDAAGVGVNAWKPEELAPAVERALVRLPEDVAAREAALDIVYQPRSGGAQLAAEAIIEWASRPYDPPMLRMPVFGAVRRQRDPVPMLPGRP